MPARAAMFADRPKGGQKALGLAGRLEAAHGPFALACGLVRVFGTVIEPLVFAMLNAGHDILVCCLVATKLVGDQHPRHIRAAFEEFAEELLGGRFVPPALDQDIEHDAILIDGTPQLGRLPIDLQKDLIEVPFVAGLGTSPA